MYPGLRFAADHYQTLCCGRESIGPVDPENNPYHTPETDDGTPITTEEFPEAEVVCPSCGRTWPGECLHEDITPHGEVVFNDRGASVGATCNDCNEIVTVYLDIVDKIKQ